MNPSPDLPNRLKADSPDLGHAKSASQFARLLKLPVAAGNKQRISDEKVMIDTIVGDVDGKDVIILDARRSCRRAEGNDLPARCRRKCGGLSRARTVSKLLSENLKIEAGRFHENQAVRRSHTSEAR